MNIKGRRQTDKVIDARTPKGAGLQKQDTLVLHESGYTAKRLTSKNLSRERPNRRDNRIAEYNIQKQTRHPQAHLDNMLNLHKLRAIRSSSPDW